MTALPTAEVLLSIREDFFSPQFTACWWKKGARLTMSSEGGKRRKNALLLQPPSSFGVFIHTYPAAELTQKESFLLHKAIS